MNNSVIVSGERPFLLALLSDKLVALLGTRIASLTMPVPAACVFNIGYISGNKQFFHPGTTTIEAFPTPGQLPTQHLENMDKAYFLLR